MALSQWLIVVKPVKALFYALNIIFTSIIMDKKHFKVKIGFPKVPTIWTPISARSKGEAVVFCLFEVYGDTHALQHP